MRNPATIMITGATDGLGRALAAQLAAEGHRLILHGRSAERLTELRRELADLGPEGSSVRPVTVRADLASLDEVRSLAEQVRDDTDQLDVLISNAGIGGGEPDGRERRLSQDGYELRFAVNYLAGFLLTLELLPLLKASGTASETRDEAGAGPARIINVASLGQTPLDFDNLMLERDYDGWRAYNQSKLAQIISGFELADRLDSTEVTVVSMHPSTYMPTKMVMADRGSSVDTLEAGTEALHRLAVGADADGITGVFYDRTEQARANEQAYDQDVRTELWRRSLELTGLAAPLD